MDKQTISWKIIDTYFRDNPRALVAHHIESFDDFMHSGIQRIIRENNPIRFIEREENAVSETQRNQCMLYIGGLDGSKIYYGKPVIFDDDRAHYMYPNEARLRNMTYGVTIHYDVDVEFIYYKDGQEFRDTTEIRNVFLGRFPIMVQSKLCILHSLSRETRFSAGECLNDYGGYFIIDGKEKSIIPQEKFADNAIYVREYKDDVYLFSADIRSVSDDSSKPTRTVSVRIVAPSSKLSNQQIVVSVPNIKSPVPLFILMRALGFISDREIIQACLLDMDKNGSMVDLFIPSVHDAGQFFTQRSALHFMAQLTKRGTVSSVLEILSDFFLPHIGDTNYVEKGYFIGYMVMRLLQTMTKEKAPTDRDNFRYKRVETSGTLLYDLFREYYLMQKRDIALKIDIEYYFHRSVYKDATKKSRNEATNGVQHYREKFMELVTDTNYKAFFSERIVEKGFRLAFKGNWGAQSHTKRIGVVQDLSRLSWYSCISQLRKINLHLGDSSKIVKPRLLNSSQWGIIDPIDTPDGGHIGLHKNMAIMTYITSDISGKDIIRWIRTIIKVVSVCDCTPSMLSGLVKLFVNGVWVGVLQDSPFDAVALIRIYRRNGIIPPFLSVLFDIENREIIVSTDAGRLMRPIFYLADTKPSYAHMKNVDELHWEDLITGTGKKSVDGFSAHNKEVYSLDVLFPEITALEQDKRMVALSKTQGIVEYMDSAEEEMALIAFTEEELNAKPYTHIEIDPSLIFGVMGNLVIYPENNPVTRNLFSCGQSKQAVSLYHTNYQSRIDKMSVVLHYGQIPLIKSRYLQYINREENPYGVNAIVAIMTYGGYNVEDAILINKGAIERGLFRTTYYSSYEAREESSRVAGTTNSKFANIEKNVVVGKKKGFDYSFLDEHGMIAENIPVTDKTILIGKIQSASGDGAGAADVWVDDSVKPKKGQVGFVDKSFITMGEEGYNIAKVRIREQRIPAIGDKMASRAGQKGTIGLIIAEEDMPFLDNGLRPDLIINPHALPSRMTLGQIVEGLFGSVCAMYGGFGDCTAFQTQGSNYVTYGPMMTQVGLHHQGNHVMYNGSSGEQIEADIFMGPTYYMRLKHMVKDKINYRARGPLQQLTRQPVHGRANDGGLRIGEMERDAVCAHGMSYFLNESFMERGDEYYMAICNVSGSIAIYNPERSLFMSPYADGPVSFHTIHDGSISLQKITRYGRSFSIVRIPYSFKLLIQELHAMHVHLRIITEENINQMTNLTYSNNITHLVNETNPLITPGTKSTETSISHSIEKLKAIIAEQLKNPTKPANIFADSMDMSPELMGPSEKDDNMTSPLHSSELSFPPVGPAFVPDHISSQGDSNPDSPRFEIGGPNSSELSYPSVGPAFVPDNSSNQSSLNPDSPQFKIGGMGNMSEGDRIISHTTVVTPSLEPVSEQEIEVKMNDNENPKKIITLATKMK